MSKKKDVISYDIYELDLYDLKCKVEALNIKETVVYGIGNNGFSVYNLFKNLGVKIKYFVDIKAENGVDSFKGYKVISPNKFKEIYEGEYVILSPSIHESIYRWMKDNGVLEEKLILSFYKTESINIDYGRFYNSSPSSDIEFCKEYPKVIKGTFFTIAYNTPENLLRRAIESVLRQTMKELKYFGDCKGKNHKAYINYFPKLQTEK